MELTKAPPASPQQSAWLEHVPPKLTQERIDELIDQFKKNYPGEILTSDTTPSVRLLSMVHEGLKTRLGWIPWQYRLSAKQYQEIHEAKAHAPKSGYWRTPWSTIRNLENKPLSAGWFLRCQTVFRNALALCHAAHLANLKLFDNRVAEYALASPALGLRTVTRQEFLSADRKLWVQKWSLDDALYELTSIRNDIPSLLHLRPVTPRLAPPEPRGHKRSRGEEHQQERPKGKAKGKGKSHDKGKTAPPGSPNPSWADTFQGKPICRRYQTGACASSKCKFLHVCAVKGCHQGHPAKEHPSNRA